MMIRPFASLVVAAVLCAAAVHAQTAPSPKPAPHSGTRGNADARPAVVVNLNTATAADLEKLPGIGAKVATRIVEYRQKNGPFKKIEELMNVQGIGEKSFLKLRNQITVGGPAPARAESAAARQQ